MNKQKSGLIAFKKYFGDGTAETEKDFLEKAFLPVERYLEIIDVPTYAPRLIVGKKGSGKSALVKYIQVQMENAGLPALLITPKDIKINNINNLSSLGDLTREYENALLTTIAVRIGEDESGVFANEGDNTLIKLAQDEGTRKLDTIEKLLKVLKPIGKTVSDIDFSKLTLRESNINTKQIQEAITNNLNSDQKVFYILIDDTDQIAAPSEPSHLNRIWAFLLAARSIMGECENIKFFITLRNEVWQRLGSVKSGQRDQVDHFRNLVYHLSPTEENIKDIILKRLQLCVSDLKLKDKKKRNYEYFFENTHVKIPGTQQSYRYWEDFISKSSRNRPRDAIQLISALSQKAIQEKNFRIESKDLEDVLPLYSEERVNDLQREVEEECDKIKEIVRAFSKFDADSGSFCYSPTCLLENLRTLPTRFSISILGETINDTDISIFQLWKYLYEIGFLNARVSDSREKEEYRHITVDDEPDLVSKTRWNDMQSMLWEIHPAYRSFLITEQKNSSFSFGIPKKKRK